MNYILYTTKKVYLPSVYIMKRGTNYHENKTQENKGSPLLKRGTSLPYGTY